VWRAESTYQSIGYSAGSGGTSAPQRSFRSGLVLDDAIARKFKKLASQWKKDTLHHSSMAQMASHPAYKQILELGRIVIPLLLEKLKHRPGMWFDALQSLTGENPVPKENRGDIEKMRSAWIQWGRDNGYAV
jgi:hypothetical protein